MDEVVHVWWATTDDLTAADVELLDDAERARRTRLQRAADRDRFVLGAALVRGLVAHLDGTDPGRVALDRTCVRCGEPHGPVTTPGRPWLCTVSHSGEYAVAAVSAARVGVDVETGCPPEWRDLLTDVLAPGEAAPSDEDGFLHLWVRKEAVLKATHEGLTRPMSSVDLAALGGLAVHDLDVPGAASALAVGGLRPARARVELRRRPAPQGG